MVSRKSKRATRVLNIELKQEKKVTAFKLGDTVRLKSGGPVMTISSVNAPVPGIGGQWLYGCVWFAEFKVETGEFPLHCIEPAAASH